MQAKNNYKIFAIILIFFSFFSFVVGYYFDENSAGAGNYKGDISIFWNNIQIFLTHDIISSINHPDYYSGRTPLLYILHKLFNPFAETIIGYRRSVFIISLALPVLFFFCLKQKFWKEDKILLLLISSIVCLSPYYRTSAYWGLEENYGLIFLLLTFLILNSFLKNNNQNGYKVYFQLFLVTLFSSCCLYFDLKLAIIPIICFLKIITSKKLSKYKIFSFISYFVLSLPYIFLIVLWDGLIQPVAAENRRLGEELYLGHIGYSITMIAFYCLPLLLFKEKKLYNLIKDFFLYRKNYYLIFLFFIYLIYLLGFYEFNEQPFLGKGYIHKTAIILFENHIVREIFTYFSFFVSWIIILIYIDRSSKDILIVFYLLIISIIIWPILQEYFDPLILLMMFTFFNSKIFLNYKNSIILFLYLSLLLILSNVYYTNLLN